MLAATTSTFAIEHPLEPTPYVGIDAQMRHMSFDRGFGRHIFKKHYPQGNVFVGLKFKDCVALELGYEFSKTQRHAKNYYTGDVVFGFAIPTPAPFVLSNTQGSHASSKISGWNLNLVGFYPILCGDNNLTLVGSIGAARLKARTREVFTTAIVVPAETITLSNTFNYKRHKTVLKIGGGLQHMMSDCLGVRALINWENTSKLHAKGKDAVTRRLATPRMAKLKNSFTYGLGAFMPF